MKTGGNPLLMARGKRGGGSWEEKNILKAWVSGRPGALFSYTTEPEGSYSIHRVFIRFLEVNRMDMGQAEKPKAAAFLTDYILLRIYVAKYVLAGYAETYAPLLDLFRGFEKWKRNSPCLWNGKQRPAMARNESFCRLICGDAMMSAVCGKLSNF